MILELKHYPDPVLKKKAKKIKEFKEEDRKLIKDMIETMYKNKGIGLAASQVGISKRIIVVDVGQGPKVFVNPEILKKQGR
ncbi:peptide deformylase, partial [bacterium (Candidatus Gribaldobacteria) CG07_land_8_20_14_0_80_33_18]